MNLLLRSIVPATLFSLGCAASETSLADQPKTPELADSSTSDAGVSAIDDSVATLDFEHNYLGKRLNTCNTFEEHVRYTRASKLFEWERCEETLAGDAGLTGGRALLHSRTLTDAESANLETSLRAITYVIESTPDGYDGYNWAMTTRALDGKSFVYKAECINGCGEDKRKAPKLADTLALLGTLQHD